jgi:translocation and assembly module TamB
VGLVAVAALVLAGAILVAWLLLTTSGARFALASVLEPVGGKADAVEGRLVGPLSVGQLEIASPAMRLRATRVALEWSPLRLVKHELRVDRLAMDSLDIETPPSTEPVRPPASLVPPLRVVLLQAAAGRVRVATAGKDEAGLVLRDVTLQGIGERDRWIVQSARAVTPVGEARLTGSLRAAAPFALESKGTLSGARNGATYRATLAATGTLAQLAVEFAGSEGGLAGSGKAAVAPFEGTPVRQLVAHLEGVDLSAFADAPRTRLTVDADLVPGDGVLLAGPVRIANAAAAPWDRGGLPLEAASAQLRMTTGRVEVRAATLRTSGGGSVRGEADWAGGRLDARVAVKDVNLLALHTALRATALSGTLAAAVEGGAQAFTVDLADPRFGIAGEARIAGGRLTARRARLTRGAALADFRGTLAFSAPQAFAVEGRIERFDPAAFAKVAAGDLNGTFTAKGVLGKSPRGEALLELARSRYAGLPAKGRAALSLEGERLAKADVDLAWGPNRLLAQGAFGGVNDALDVTFASPDLAPLGKLFGLALGGKVDVAARLAGTLASPAVKGTVDAAGLRLPEGSRIASLAARVDVGRGDASTAVAEVDIRGVQRGDEAAVLLPSASLQLKGTRAAHDIRFAAEFSDKSTIRALLAGGVAPGWGTPEWRGRLESVEVKGQTELALAAPAPLIVSRGRIELAEAILAGEPGQARFAFTRWTPAGIEARGSLRGVFVRSITRILGLQGQLSSNLIMAGEWDVRLGETVDGFVSLQRERGEVRLGDPRQALGLEALSLRAEASGSRLRASLDLRGKRAGQWQGELTATLRRNGLAWEVSPDAPLEGSFDIDVPDLAWTAAWLGPDARAGGRLKGAGRVSGTARDPAWSGRLEATGLVIRDPSLGAEVADGTIAIAFRDREARIERLVLTAPWRPDADAARDLASVKRPDAGEVTAEGALDLGTRKGTVRVRSAAFPLTRLATRFLAVSGEGRADFDGATTALSGSFTADAGWFGIPAAAPPSLSDDVIVERGPKAPEEAKGRERIRLDLRVGLGDNLYFRGRGVATRLAGELRLAGDVGPNLRTTGTIRAVGGTYDAYGRTLALERGALNFVGAVDNPGLNILALRKGLPVEAGVEITGTVNRPKARLVSSPDVPDAEKLSWLVLGRGQGDVGASDAALLADAATALLGRNVLPADKIIRGLGIDDIRVGRDDTGNLGALPESTVAGKTGATSAAEVLTVGKRLTDEIYVSYRQGLADAEGSLRVAYQFSKSLQFILQAGDRQGVDAVYRFSLDDVPRLVK